MRAQINAVTIAATDLLTLKNFYANIFGWEIQSESTEIVMFRLKHGLMLSIYAAANQARYLGLSKGVDEARAKMYLTSNTASLKETDELFAELEKKGVNIIKMPSNVFWGGYAGIVTDPEGNYWEICFNPFL